MIQIIAAILSMAGSWMVYKKMGRQGWEGIVPIYIPTSSVRSCMATAGNFSCC